MNRSSKHVLLGTAKGLVVIDLQESARIADVHFEGFAVNMVYVDKRSERWWAGLSHKHWGQKLHYSNDAGASWKKKAVPKFGDATLPNGKPARLRQIWCMQHGGVDKPNVLWMGTDPGGLFKSENGGETFKLVTSLWKHPSRKDELQWFGAGSDYPYIHSIVLDPKDSNHLYIAVSCAGVFETKDGGESWSAKNAGLKAAYLPNPDVEVGHDPHAVKMPDDHNHILWQQNHCGVYLSKDAANSWNDVSGSDGMPSYGFALAVDEKDPAYAWVVPADSDERRIAPNLALKVFQTSDFGQSWQEVSEGLPQEFAFDIVLRHAFDRREDYMVMGTTNGNVYMSKGPYVHWQSIAKNLTKVNSVMFSF